MTDSYMKRLTSCAGLLLAALSPLFISSCIYDAPGDKFYRTLWVCDGGVMTAALDEDLSSDYGSGADLGIASGTGIGSGSRYGYGAGYGSSSGYGLGSGDGSGYGSGSDSGYGSGYDYGSGYEGSSVSDLVSDAVSSQRPSLSNFTIEFLCDGIVSVRADGAAGSYGSYEPHGNTACFTNLLLTFRSSDTCTTIIIEQATRHDDLLEINWHLSGSTTSHLTTLSRKSSYN